MSFYLLLFISIIFFKLSCPKLSAALDRCRRVVTVEPVALLYFVSYMALFVTNEQYVYDVIQWNQEPPVSPNRTFIRRGLLRYGSNAQVSDDDNAVRWFAILFGYAQDAWNVPITLRHHDCCRCPGAKIGARPSTTTMLTPSWLWRHRKSNRQVLCDKSGRLLIAIALYEIAKPLWCCTDSNRRNFLCLP